MRALLQRVSEASVKVEGAIVGQIGPGLLILVCAMEADTIVQAQNLVAKISKLRIFRDEAGKMNQSIRDVGGAALIVSQFTLAAELRGNRPGFSKAANPDEARHLYEQFTALMAAEGISTANGVFGADMAVSLINDGPVTIWMDTADQAA